MNTFQLSLCSWSNWMNRNDNFGYWFQTLHVVFFIWWVFCILRSCANRFLPNMAPARLLFQLRKHTLLYTTLQYFCNKGDFKIIYVASIGVCNCLHWTKLMSLGKMRWYLPGCLILAGWAVQSLRRLFPGNSLETSRKGAVFASTAQSQDPAGWKWSRSSWESSWRAE